MLRYYSKERATQDHNENELVTMYYEEDGWVLSARRIHEPEWCRQGYQIGRYH